MKKIDINPNILMGVSSSATQIDGGELGHTWNYWYSGGKAADPSVSAGHWDKFREDCATLHALGVQTYRFSIDWARIEPSEGSFDEFAIDHIKEELMLLHAMKIRPIICLHHFTNPLWFDACGGWSMSKNIVYYLRYVERIITRLGHLCDDYITINEPNTYAFNGYHHGIWPPAKKKFSSAMNVISVMVAAHIRAYRLIHRLRAEMGLGHTMVGISLQMRVFEAKHRTNPAHNGAAAMAERMYQTLLAEAVTIGKFSAPLKNLSRAKIGRYCDFHGLSFSTRTIMTSTHPAVRPHSAKCDSRLEICPRGILLCARKLMKICALPIFVTDSGINDVEDKFRCRYIYDTVMAISKSTLPFERYYHRSFLDGFEWLDGYNAKFGLVEVDFETGERKMKKSGEFYRELITQKCVTSEMYAKFIAMQSYHH